MSPRATRQAWSHRQAEPEPRPRACLHWGRVAPGAEPKPRLWGRTSAVPLATVRTAAQRAWPRAGEPGRVAPRLALSSETEGSGHSRCGHPVPPHSLGQHKTGPATKAAWGQNQASFGRPAPQSPPAPLWGPRPQGHSKGAAACAPARLGHEEPRAAPSCSPPSPRRP